MSRNGDKFPTCGFHFSFPSPAECDSCNLSVTTQTLCDSLAVHHCFERCKAEKKAPGTSFTSVVAAIRRLRCVGTSHTMTVRLQEKPLSSSQVAMGTQQVPGD